MLGTHRAQQRNSDACKWHLQSLASISYRGLSSCLVHSNAQGRGKVMLGSSPATPKNSLSCRLPAHAHSADHSCQTLLWLTLQAQLLYGKPEAFRTSEVQALFANIKNLPACWEGQNNAPFVSQPNLQNKAYVFSFPFIKGKNNP